jgi:hypothetical protein
MNEQISQWFEQSAPFEGILACGIRRPDHSTMTKSWAEGYSELAMENTLRCVADLFQVLPLNRLPQGRVRWVYENALLHCERRADGTCLGIFTLREETHCDAAGLERVFAEFQALAQANAP